MELNTSFKGVVLMGSIFIIFLKEKVQDCESAKLHEDFRAAENTE